MLRSAQSSVYCVEVAGKRKYYANLLQTEKDQGPKPGAGNWAFYPGIVQRPNNYALPLVSSHIAEQLVICSERGFYSNMVLAWVTSAGISAKSPFIQSPHSINQLEKGSSDPTLTGVLTWSAKLSQMLAFMWSECQNKPLIQRSTRS